MNHGVEKVNSLISVFLAQNFKVFQRIAPNTLPTVQMINNSVVELGSGGDYSWAHLQGFFNGNAEAYFSGNLKHVPIGDSNDTLTGIVKCVGLSECFADRARTFADKRKKALKLLDEIDAPAHPRCKDSNRRGHRIAKLPEGVFSFRVPDLYSCYEHPTTRTILVDIMNTIWLSYGQHFSSDNPLNPVSGGAPQSQIEMEWNKVIGHEKNWQETGGGDDAFLSTWLCYSPAALLSIKGQQLEGLCTFAENVPANMYRKNRPVFAAA